MSLLLGEADEGLLEVSLDVEDDVDGVADEEGELVLELFVLDEVEGVVVVAAAPLSRCCAVPAPVAGNAEVDGELAVVGGVYGLEAAFGELLLGTDEVCATVTPAALTMATTAAMLKVLDTFFIFELLCERGFPASLAAARQLPRSSKPAMPVPNRGTHRRKGMSEDAYPRSRVSQHHLALT